MEWVKRRDERSIRVYPYKVAHPALGDEFGDLIGSIAVRVNKKAAVALADVFNEEVYEQGGLAHAAHSGYVHVFGRIYKGLVARY